MPGEEGAGAFHWLHRGPCGCTQMCPGKSSMIRVPYVHAIRAHARTCTAQTRSRNKGKICAPIPYKGNRRPQDCRTKRHRNLGNTQHGGRRLNADTDPDSTGTQARGPYNTKKTRAPCAPLPTTLHPARHAPPGERPRMPPTARGLGLGAVTSEKY